MKKDRRGTAQRKFDERVKNKKKQDFMSKFTADITREQSNDILKSVSNMFIDENGMFCGTFEGEVINTDVKVNSLYISKNAEKDMEEARRLVLTFEFTCGLSAFCFSTTILGNMTEKEVMDIKNLASKINEAANSMPDELLNKKTVDINMYLRELIKNNLEKDEMDLLDANFNMGNSMVAAICKVSEESLPNEIIVVEKEEKMFYHFVNENNGLIVSFESADDYSRGELVENFPNMVDLNTKNVFEINELRWDMIFSIVTDSESFIEKVLNKLPNFPVICGLLSKV